MFQNGEGDACLRAAEASAIDSAANINPTVDETIARPLPIQGTIVGLTSESIFAPSSGA
jgi:hypothetical protein